MQRVQQEELGITSGLDEGEGVSFDTQVFVPHPEHLRQLSQLGASPELLELDPSGFLVQFLTVAEGDTRPTPLSSELCDISWSITERIAKAGPPKNPDAATVLRELFTPQLVRECISNLLQSGARSSGYLVSVTALSFIYHPAATLAEVRFLSWQVFRSPAQRGIWKEVAEGLIGACQLVPSLLTALAPGQHRIVKGPDFLDRYLQSLPYAELLELPAFVVEKALAAREAPTKEQAEMLLEAIAGLPNTLLDSPGLLPMLRQLRRSRGSFGEPLVSKLVDEIRRALTARGEGSPLKEWVNAHRSGEPTRREGDAEFLVRTIQEELLEFEEFRTHQIQPEKNALEVLSDIREQRAQMLERAQTLVTRILRADSDFRNQDIRDLTVALESYGDQQLERCIAAGETWLAGGDATPLGQSGCEFAIKCAQLGSDKLRELPSAVALFSQNPPDAAYRVVIRVISTQAPHDELAKLLHRSSLGHVWGDVLEAWDILPSGHDVALFRSLIPRAEPLGVSMYEVVKGCRRWGGIPDAEIALLVLQPSEPSVPSNDDHIARFLCALSKIRITEPQFVQWRSALVQSIVSDPATNTKLQPHHKSILISLLYEGVLMQELEESPLSTGLRTNMCSLKLSPRESTQLSTECKKVLEQVNRWMNGAFSDYALDRGLFTSVSALLEEYGQTRRTLKDLRLEVKEALRVDPRSVPTQKLLSVITIFQKARRSGEDVERLRRRLARRGFLRYEEKDIPVLAATETYVRRFGLKQRSRPLVDFPALSLLQRIGRTRFLVLNEATNPGSVVHTARRSREEFEALVSLCRTAVESELSLKRPLSFMQLLKIPAERRYLLDVLAKILLGSALLCGAGLAVRDLSVAAWTMVGGSLRHGLGGDLATNGSIPKNDRVLARLARPFKDSRDSFLVSGLVGVEPASATQPMLVVKEVSDWVSLRGSDGSYLSADYVEFRLSGVHRDDEIPLPIGARIVDEFRALEFEEFRARAKRDVNELVFHVFIPREPEVDVTLNAAEIVQRHGWALEALSNPRLQFSTVREASPRLADAIEVARTMKAVDAAEHLRGFVSTLLSYEETPEYDNFHGTFEDYFRTILANGKGICGQFSVVFDEALKHAGIPSCIARGYMPKDDGITYTTRGAHATNLVFLSSTAKRVVPRRYDATGEGVLPSANSEADEGWMRGLGFPEALAIGSATAAGLLLLRRRRSYVEKAENEALEKARHGQDSAEELLRESEATSEFGSELRPRELDPEFVFSEWILHHVRMQEGSDRGKASSIGLCDLEELDIDAALQSVEMMKRSLVVVTPTTRLILSMAGMVEQENTVGIVNAWLLNMQDPAQHPEWMQRLQRAEHFSPQEVDALLRLAREVVPGFKGDLSRRSFLSRWSPFTGAVSFNGDCLLRAFCPPAGT